MRAIRILAAATLLLAGCASREAAADEYKALRGYGPVLAGPVVGLRDATHARVWLALDPAATDTCTLELRPEGGEVRSLPLDVATATLGGIVELAGLAPATSYRYRLMQRGAEVTAGRGSFRTPPVQGSSTRMRLALASCMRVQSFVDQPGWGLIAAENPDLIVHLGDNVYADSSKLEKQRELNFAQRNVPQHRAAMRRAATLAIWDDHDFGKNDGDGTFAGKADALEIFRALWPNPPMGLPDTPGVFSRFSWGDVDLFLLDTRYHRSPNTEEDRGAKTMLGEAQWRWLEEGLRSSKARFKLVASGSTFQASYKDYWGLYERDRDRLVKLTWSVPGMLLLSGDIHISTIETVDRGAKSAYPLREVVSSGVAARVFDPSCAILDIDTTVPDPTIRVRVLRIAGDETELQRDETYRLSELTPIS